MDRTRGIKTQYKKKTRNLLHGCSIYVKPWRVINLSVWIMMLTNDLANHAKKSESGRFLWCEFSSIVRARFSWNMCIIRELNYTPLLCVGLAAFVWWESRDTHTRRLTQLFLLWDANKWTFRKFGLLNNSRWHFSHRILTYQVDEWIHGPIWEWHAPLNGHWLPCCALKSIWDIII